MKLQSYFNAPTESEADRCIMDRELVVNCSGIVQSSCDFYASRARNDFYLIYATGGNMSVKTDGKVQLLEKNTFIILKPNCRFEYWSKDFIHYYWIHFTGNCAEKLLSSLDISLNKVYSAQFSDNIKQLFENIFNELIFTSSYSDINMAGILISMLAQISMAKNNNISSKVLKSVDYINKHYNENISLKQLAGIENLSVSHYRSVFKKATGISPMAYITNQRINAACQYLSQYNMSVKETSFAVGYTDSLYFSRVFKKATGLTPRDYRSTQ